jgi:hypothetical protein
LIAHTSDSMSTINPSAVNSFPADRPADVFVAYRRTRRSGPRAGQERDKSGTRSPQFVDAAMLTPRCSHSTATKSFSSRLLQPIIAISPWPGPPWSFISIGLSTLLSRMRNALIHPAKHYPLKTYHASRERLSVAVIDRYCFGRHAAQQSRTESKCGCQHTSDQDDQGFERKNSDALCGCLRASTRCVSTRLMPWVRSPSRWAQWSVLVERKSGRQAKAARYTCLVAKKGKGKLPTPRP